MILKLAKHFLLNVLAAVSYLHRYTWAIWKGTAAINFHALPAVGKFLFSPVSVISVTPGHFGMGGP
jgi:hypothetical protein